jgi:2-iminobutanoate/2-iminopropanoate deaminase
MKVSIDNPAGVPAPAGPYSHVARVDVGGGSLLFLAGQVAVDDEGNVVGEGDMAAQAERTFQIIEGILAGHGATFDHVVHIRTFLTDMSMRAEYGKVRARYFRGTPPASTTVEVSGLFRPGLVIEIEITAAVPAVGSPGPAARASP